MKFITWNLNGIRARQGELQQLIETEQPDILCLQEIKASPDQVPALLVSLQDYWCYWHGAGGYSGVGLLVRHSFFTKRPVFSHPYFDMERRIVVADLGELLVASVYVPNGGKDYDAKLRFFGEFAAWSAGAAAAGQTLIVAGDMNVAREERDVHLKLRKTNQIGTRPEEKALLTRMLDSGLSDIGRHLDPANEDLFTWWPPWRQLRQRNIGWRIDYVLAGSPLAGRATSSESRREFGTSDHAPVIVNFAA